MNRMRHETRQQKIKLSRNSQNMDSLLSIRFSPHQNQAEIQQIITINSVTYKNSVIQWKSISYIVQFHRELNLMGKSIQCWSICIRSNYHVVSPLSPFRHQSPSSNYISYLLALLQSKHTFPYRTQLFIASLANRFKIDTEGQSILSQTLTQLTNKAAFIWIFFPSCYIPCFLAPN